jgi:hypothetical protein
MYKVMAFIARKDGISREDFRTYYENNHIRLIAEVAPRMVSYRRNYLNPNEPFLRNEDQIDFDVVTEMEFNDRTECERWFEAFREPTALARVIEDEGRFIDVDRVRVCPVDVEDAQR